MQLQCQWQGKMRFQAQAGNHTFPMDTKSPLGEDSAPTPKQLLLAGICGCTAMDAIALLKKYKQTVETFTIDADAPMTTGGYPEIFAHVHLTFSFTGAVDPARALEAVQLSQTKYCGVSAMVFKSVPIRYSVIVNGTPAGEGVAQFELK